MGLYASTRLGYRSITLDYESTTRENYGSSTLGYLSSNVTKQKAGNPDNSFPIDYQTGTLIHIAQIYQYNIRTRLVEELHKVRVEGRGRRARTGIQCIIVEKLHGGRTDDENQY